MKHFQHVSGNLVIYRRMFRKIKPKTVERLVNQHFEPFLAAKNIDFGGGCARCGECSIDVMAVDGVAAHIGQNLFRIGQIEEYINFFGALVACKLVGDIEPYIDSAGVNVARVGIYTRVGSGRRQNKPYSEFAFANPDLDCFVIFVDWRKCIANLFAYIRVVFAFFEICAYYHR